MPDRTEAVELGTMMREMREAHKRDLPQVAAELRIRQVYLQAIEEGRYSDLPGPTYALGFVRAYADYLGLEPEDTVQRFKNALGGLNSPTNLILPSPVTEGRLPTGSILLVAAILAIGAYGGWYYLTTHGQGADDIVSMLPDRLARLVGPKDATGPASAPASSETGAVATVSTPPRDKPKTPAASASAPKSAEASPKPARKPAETPARQPAAAESAPPAPPAAPEPPPSVAMAPAAPAPPEPIAEPVSRGPEPDEGAAAGNRVESAADSQESAESQAASASSGPRGDSDEAPATEATPARRPVETLRQAARSEAPALVGGGIIIVKATADSWVEVRDAQNNRVFSRVLRAGETYDVPAANGLTMMTGNAGALEIMVRGQPAPPLGPIGAVRRDVALDPARLLAGTAIAN